MREAREFEIAYRIRITGLLDQWNTNVQAGARDTLVVRTELVELRIVSGGARFFAGAFAGDSFLDLDLRLVNKHTGEQISKVRVRKDADAMGGAWSVGKTDQNLDQYVIEIIRTYLSNNYDNLATVAPVADDETSAMDRYYEGLLKDKRDNQGCRYVGGIRRCD